MARREAFVTIDAEGRDKGKVFRITEQPASVAEEWVAEAFAGIAAAGVDVPEDIAQAGAAGMMAFGLRGLAKMPWQAARPLYGALMACVMLQPDPTGNPTFVRHLVETDTEEVATRLKLRLEVLKLHAAF